MPFALRRFRFLLMSILCASPAFGSILMGTFDPHDPDLYSPNAALYVGQWQDFNLHQGIPLNTRSFRGTLDRIETAISFAPTQGSGNTIRLSLHEDASGVPGTMLGFAEATPKTPFGALGPALDFQFQNRVHLVENSTYHIVASAPTQSLTYWNLTTTELGFFNYFGTVAYHLGDENWETYLGAFPALRVFATPVPEPSAAGFLLAIVWVAAGKRNRSTKHAKVGRGIRAAGVTPALMIWGPLSGLVASISLLLHAPVDAQQRYEAQLRYEFVESNTREVLAALELSGLPAVHSDVVDFQLTTAGVAVFPDATPPHQFWMTSFSSVSETLPAHLGCTDCEPGQSNWFLKFPGAFNQFKIWFSNEPGMDQITYDYDFGPPTKAIARKGNWVRHVPEGSVRLWIVAAFAWASSRRIER